MTHHQKVCCPTCGSNHTVKAGKSAKGIQRYRCQNEECQVKSFMLEYSYKAYEHGIKDQLIDMVTSGNGIRNTARTLNISKGTVISTLKKERKKRKSNNPS